MGICQCQDCRRVTAFVFGSHGDARRSVSGFFRPDSEKPRVSFEIARFSLDFWGDPVYNKNG